MTMTTTHHEGGGDTAAMPDAYREAVHAARIAVCDSARAAAAEGRDTQRLDRVIDTLDAMLRECCDS